MIEDLTDCPNFHGFTGEDDIFDVADLQPASYEGMTCLRTQISLNRGCDWNDVKLKMSEHVNTIVVCPIGVINEESYEIAKSLVASKPADLTQVVPVYIINTDSFENNEALNKKVSELARMNGGMIACSKFGHESA